MNFGKKKKKTIEEIDESYNSYLSAPDGEIIEKSSGRDAARTIATGLGGGVKFILGIILLIVLVLGTSYTLLGGTLMFLAPNSDSAVDRTWVSRGTFDGGKIKAGTIVYASSTQASPEGMFSKIIESYVGTPDSFIAKTIAGPIVEVSSKNGVIHVNGKATEHKGNIEKTELRDEYLMKCMSGSCGDGEYMVVPYSTVSGEVKGVIGLSGVNLNESK